MKNNLPKILITSRHIRDISQSSWEALIGANRPPVLFQRGHVLVELLTDDMKAPFLRPLDLAALRGRLDRAADFVSLDRNNNFQVANPPNNVIQDMLSAPDLPLPVLRGIATAPVFAPSGVIHNAPGYDPDTGFYVHLARELTIPLTPSNPDKPTLELAKHLILSELLGDFIFVSDADRAHAVALLLQPFVRLMIDGSTPLYMIESATPGTGKGLLVSVLTIPTAGQAPAVMAAGRDEEEWRKRITSTLIKAPQFVIIDNIRSRLDSAVLSSALTAPTWEDRLLGQSRNIALPVTCTWIATANNPALSSEIARRTVSIRIDSTVERPGERTGFRHNNLRLWCLQKRGELISAALTLVNAWIAAGRPPGQEIMGSFESYAEIMGGILGNAGIPGFLANRNRVYSNSDDDLLPWRDFVNAWWQKFQGKAVTATELLPLAVECGLVENTWHGELDNATRTRFGKALSRIQDRVIGNHRIRRAGHDSHTKAVIYKLELINSEKTTQTAGVAGVAGVSPPLFYQSDLESGVSNIDGGAGISKDKILQGAIIPRNPPQPPQQDQHSTGSGHIPPKTDTTTDGWGMV